VPALIQSAVSPKEFRKNWALLIQIIYHVNPLLCPKCYGSIKIISFIDQEKLIERILRHLGYGMPETMARPLKVPPISLNLHMTILILSFSPRRRLSEPEAAQRLFAPIARFLSSGHTGDLRLFLAENPNFS